MKIKYYKYAYKSYYNQNSWKKIYLPFPFDQAKKFMILWHEAVLGKLEDFLILEESTNTAELQVLSYYEHNPEEIVEWPIALTGTRIISYEKTFHYLNYIKNFIND